MIPNIAIAFIEFLTNKTGTSSTRFAYSYTRSKTVERQSQKQELLLAKINVEKTSQFKTQCKGDISHASKTAKITMFDPVICKTPDAPFQDELLCIV